MKLAPTLLLAVALPLAAAAQTLTTDEAGRQVIVYPDGSTRAFDPSADQADSTQATLEAPAGDVPTSAAAGTPQVSIPTPRVLTPEQEDEARDYAKRQVKVLRKQAKSLRKDARRARNREADLAERVAELKASNKIADRSQIEIITQKLQVQRRETSALEDALARAERHHDALEATLDLSQAERERRLAAEGIAHLVRSRGSARPQANDPALAPSGEPGSLPPMAGASQTPDAIASGGGAAAPASAYASYRIEDDTRYYPPTAPCMQESSGIDEFTQQRRVQLAPELLFAYTTPELRAYLGGESLISCYARLVRLGPAIALETEYVIRSQFASKEFGVLPRGSQLTIRTVGGAKLVLRNQAQSQASYDPVTKVSTYRGTYPISKGQAKFLRKAHLDQVRVMWGTGFDDYAIYDLTLLQRQLDCL